VATGQLGLNDFAGWCRGWQLQGNTPILDLLLQVAVYASLNARLVSSALPGSCGP
jgi:hypothetical protein